MVDAPSRPSYAAAARRAVPVPQLATKEAYGAINRRVVALYIALLKTEGVAVHIASYSPDPLRVRFVVGDETALVLAERQGVHSVTATARGRTKYACASGPNPSDIVTHDLARVVLRELAATAREKKWPA